MDNFLNQTVRLIGKVKQLRGDQAVIESDGNVTVHLNRVCSAYLFLGSVTWVGENGGVCQVGDELCVVEMIVMFMALRSFKVCRQECLRCFASLSLYRAAGRGWQCERSP